MSSRKAAIRKPRLGPRRPSGAVLPLVAFLLVLGIAFVAFTVDVMRTFFPRSQVLYGAQACALAAYSKQVGTVVLPTSAGAQNNMLAFIEAQSASSDTAFNEAIAGPDTSSPSPTGTRSPILFTDADAAFVSNPQDAQEIFLQLTARRQDTDALKRSFMPLIFAFNNSMFAGGAAPPLSQTGTVEPSETAEVIGQPASRISQGVAHNSAVQGKLAGFAAFPIAISNAQFASLAQGSTTGTSVTFDLLSAAGYPSLSTGHLRAAFVNLGPGSGNLSYYGTSTGSVAASQLLGNLNYFAPPYSGELPPLQVERGSQLSAVTTDTLSADPTYAAAINKAFGSVISGGSYIFPVLKGDPVSGSNSSLNTVVGFALLTLKSVSTSPFTVSVSLAPSTVMPGATFDHALRTVQISAPAPMPAPLAPFLDRQPQGAGIEPRLAGLALAPSLSPRSLN